MADGWDDFSNNLATDLGPLISLFGEAPTKQYLSECLNWTDIIIFATCPLGIITAIVSVIRVCGSPSLRAFIGRAQEGAGTAEAELCSSTSREVCELFNNRGIVRVLGRPKLLEFVHHPISTAVDFGQQNPYPKAGLYLSKDYFADNHGDLRKRSKKEWEEMRRGLEFDFAPNPNLSLNVGIKPRSRFWFNLAACIGILLQSFVLVWASIARYMLGLIKNDLQDHYAVPLTVIGTIFLCTGMGLCASLIEGSTTKRTWVRRTNLESKGRFFWLQPGNQLVGDQVFDAFAYTHLKGRPLTYITSYKRRGRNPIAFVWAALLATVIGFVAQFLGLRACHSSVAVVQLGTVLVMSLIRAGLRTERLKKHDNILLRDFDDGTPSYLHGTREPDKRIGLDTCQGHELDWIALEIERRSDPRTDPNARSVHTWRVSTIQRFPPKRALSESSEDPNAVMRAFAYRARLADLTGLRRAARTISTSTWNDNQVGVRKIARNLAGAIQRTAQILFDSKAAHPVLLKNDWQGASEIFWAIQVSLKAGIDAEETIINLSVGKNDASRGDGASNTSWIANIAELEGVLGLWIWSMKCEITRLTSGRDSSIHFGRIMSTNPEDELEFNIWRRTGESEIRKTAILGPVSSNKLWRRTLGPHGVFEQVEQPQLDFSFHMFFGLHVLPECTEGKLTVLETMLTQSLCDTCAQELYLLFLVSSFQMIDHIGGKNILDKESGRLVNDNVSSLFDAFTNNKLGSRGDAFSCIIPALKMYGHLPRAENLHLRAAIDAGLQDLAIKLLGLIPNPDEGAEDDWTPLMSAASRGYGGVVKAILGTGKVDFWKALRVSVQKGDYPMAETLLKIGQVDLDPRYVPRPQLSLLQIATEKGSDDLVALLLLRNAAPDVQDETGWTPLCVAVGNGHLKIVKRLLQTDKVDVNLRYPQGRPNRTLLQVAIEEGFDEIAKELVISGRVSDVDARDKEGYTPLLAAAETGQKEMVKFFWQLDVWIRKQRLSPAGRP